LGKNDLLVSRPHAQIQAFFNIKYARYILICYLAVRILKGIFLILINSFFLLYNLQDQFGDYDENEIKKIDENINNSTEKLKRLQETLKTQETGVIVAVVFFFLNAIKYPLSNYYKINKLKLPKDLLTGV